MYYHQSAWNKWGAEIDERVSEDAIEEKDVEAEIKGRSIAGYLERRPPDHFFQHRICQDEKLPIDETRPRYSKESRKVGNAGEKLVLKKERMNLIEAQRPDLAEMIVHEADLWRGGPIFSLFKCYDILSYNPDGSRFVRLVEDFQ